MPETDGAPKRALPETDGAPKRALRRAGSSRNNSLTRGILPQGLSPRGTSLSPRVFSLSPRVLQSRGSTRDKYVRMDKEEKERKEGILDGTGDNVQSGEGGPRSSLGSAATGAAADKGRGISQDKGGDDRRRNPNLTMSRVDGVSSTVGPTSSQRSRKSLPLAERECIPTHQVIDVLESLSSTLIFNSANKEEKLALASRLRHWVVEDGTYLIREGDGDRNRSAIFVIASGKATISLNRTLEDDTVQEADIKDIKSPNYFGEGRVLGDSRAYASVRAKEELVVYYIMRADVEEIVSPTTRNMMVRDMHIRKFQKENLDDLFAVIREKPSGLSCLKRFADEQLMGGDVGFFIDVEEYKKTEASDTERTLHAQRIVGTYISPTTGGPGLIYTSEAQRKALAVKMKRLWGRPSTLKDTQGPGGPGLLVRKSGGGALDDRGANATLPPLSKGENDEHPKDQEARGVDTAPNGDGHEANTAADGGQGSSTGQGTSENAVAEGPGEGEGGPPNGGDPGGVLIPPGQCLDDEKRSQRSDSDGSCAWSGSYRSGIESDNEPAEGREEAQLALALSLFDEILDQNAIPTIRQNIVPKFIQSSYYEVFLAELFPYESRAVTNTDQGDEEKDSDSRGGALTASLEAIRHDPEAVAKRIAEAVAAARAAAEAEAVAAAEAAAALEAEAEKVEGDMRQQADSEGQPGLPEGEAVSRPRSAVGSGEDDQQRSHHETLPGAGDAAAAANNALGGTLFVKGADPEVFSDEPLFAPGCRDEGIASRISRRGLYGLDAASNVCTLM